MKRICMVGIRQVFFVFRERPRVLETGEHVGIKDFMKVEEAKVLRIIASFHLLR
jgi:hypothetical protein